MTEHVHLQVPNAYKSFATSITDIRFADMVVLVVFTIEATFTHTTGFKGWIFVFAVLGFPNSAGVTSFFVSLVSLLTGESKIKITSKSLVRTYFIPIKACTKMIKY